MLFAVERDAGYEIYGYVVLDTFSSQADIVVSSRGEELLRLTAGDVRPALQAYGRHETGLVGFYLSEANLPGLTGLDELEIHEPESGILVYRRSPPEAVVPRKIFRLETQLLPINRLDRALRPYFRFYFPLIDRFGLETSNQVFMLGGDSIYVSGRIPYRSLEQHIERGYGSIVLVQDPYDELAERLLVLRLIAKGYNSYLGPRDAVVFEEAVSFAAALTLEDEREMKWAFRDVSRSVFMALADPLMRQLTTHLPDEAVNPSAIGSALNILSSFEVVGLRRQADLFIEAIADLFLLDPAELPAIEQAPATQLLADMLRRCAPVEQLLENDLALYGYIKDAFEKPGSEA